MSLFVLVVRVLQLRVVEQTVEIPQLLFVDEIVVILDDPFSLVKSLIKNKSEGTDVSADEDQFGRVKAVTHVMWGTDQAEARQL